MDSFKLCELHILQLKLKAVKEKEYKNFEFYDHSWEYTYCMNLGMPVQWTSN
jgi:hypothetical protein